MVRRGVDAHLWIVGDGDRRFTLALREQVRDQCLEQRVTFVGYVNDPVQFIRMSNVTLVCSKWEAFGRVIVESMLAGKPVIATANSGGTAELIEEGKTGLLYERGKPTEFADETTVCTKIRNLHQSWGKPATHGRLVASPKSDMRVKSSTFLDRYCRKKKCRHDNLLPVHGQTSAITLGQLISSFNLALLIDIPSFRTKRYQVASG